PSKNQESAQEQAQVVSRVRVSVDSLRSDVHLLSNNMTCEVKFHIEVSGASLLVLFNGLSNLTASSIQPHRSTPSHNFSLNFKLYDPNDRLIGDGPVITVDETKIHGTNGYRVAITQLANGTTLQN